MKIAFFGTGARKTLFLTFIVFYSSFSFGRVIDFKIDLYSGNVNEKKAGELIKDFTKKYDLSPYMFTQHILIQSMVIPHSHPVLTLNTRQISDPDRYLALLLHEEIHWFFAADERVSQLKTFIAKLKEKYPKVPVRKDGGAEDEKSTYLHFGVCYYELEATSKYLGEKKAIENFGSEDIYSWIRKQILNDREFVKKTLIDSGLQWKDANLDL